MNEVSKEGRKERRFFSSFLNASGSSIHRRSSYIWASFLLCLSLLFFLFLFFHGSSSSNKIATKMPARPPWLDHHPAFAGRVYSDQYSSLLSVFKLENRLSFFFNFVCLIHGFFCSYSSTREGTQPPRLCSKVSITFNYISTNMAFFFTLLLYSPICAVYIDFCWSSLQWTNDWCIVMCTV